MFHRSHLYDLQESRPPPANQRRQDVALGFAALATTLTLSATVVISVSLTYLTWTNLISWHVVSHKTTPLDNDIVRDPLVVALMAIAVVAFLEMLNLVIWVWIGSKTVFNKRQTLSIFIKRGSEQHPGGGAVAAVIFNVTVIDLILQIATVAYLLLVDVIFPALHQHPADLYSTLSRNKRPITTILHDEHPHQMALEEAMTIYRGYQPVLVASYVISVLLKTIWLRSFQNSSPWGDRNASTFDTKTNNEKTHDESVRSHIAMESWLEDDTGYNKDGSQVNICHSYNDGEDDKSLESNGAVLATLAQT